MLPARRARALSPILPVTLAALCLAPAVRAQQPAERREVVIDRGAHTPTISPDGSTIALGILGKIWLLPTRGGDARQISFGDGWDHHPAWSPDGSRLAWVHDTPAASEIVLHSLGLGTSRTLHARSPAEAVGSGRWGPVYSFASLAFHPTNGRLYFIDFRSGIWSVDAVAGRAAPEQLLPGTPRLGRPGITDLSTFAFSPDGRRIAVEKDTTDMWTDLHVTPLEGLDLIQVTATTRIKRTDVEWTPDGASLVYLERTGAREGIAVQPLAGGEARRLPLGTFNGRELTLFPDGRHVLVVSGRRLFRVDLESGAQEAVPFRARFLLPGRAAGDLVITNARLFDGTGAAVLENATVEVRNGRIAAVGTGPYRGSEVRVFDAQGRFLMPGLADAHDHVSTNSALLLSGLPTRGVTTLLDMGSYLPETLNLRDAIELGVVGGPRIYTSGPTIDGPEGRARPLTIANVTDPGEGRALVRGLAAQGVDLIKIYAFLEPAVSAAVIAEAHAQGLPAVGDFVATPWAAALEAGVDGFVHLMEHKWRFVAREQPDPAAGPWAVVEPDNGVMAEFFTRVARRGAMFDPTLMASSQLFDATAFDAALREGVGDTAAVRRTRTLAGMLRAMHRHGVRWVAGTDAGPGLLVHELRMYEAAGIPNATILQTATSNVARWLKQNDFGTVEPGKRADLILVDGDPLQRIQDLENLVLVVQNGRIVMERPNSEGARP